MAKYHIELLRDGNYKVIRTNARGKASRPIGCSPSDLPTILGPGARPDVIAELRQRLTQHPTVVVEINDPE
jgi:hypothetical protein